jgi:uncharacterized membrane protein
MQSGKQRKHKRKLKPKVEVMKDDPNGWKKYFIGIVYINKNKCHKRKKKRYGNLAAAK